MKDNGTTKDTKYTKKDLGHGWNTDQTRIVVRVPSVFNPWLPLVFVSFVYFVVPSPSFSIFLSPIFLSNPNRFLNCPERS